MFKNLRRILWVVVGFVLANLAYRYLWPYLDPQRPRFVTDLTPLRSLEGVLGASRRTDGAGLYWLDNQRLLVVADVLPADARPDHYVEPQEKSLYIWHTQTRQYSKYRDLPPHDFAGLCHYRGRIWYRSGVNDEQDVASYWSGQIGSEVEIRMPLQTARADYLNGDRFLNNLSCNVQDAQQALRPEHRKPASQASVVWLREQDGYIFLNDPLDPLHRDSNGNAVYYRADGSPPVTLPIPAAQLQTAGVDYSEFADEYVITPGNGDGPGPGAGTIYLMKPDGTVRRNDLPARLKLSGNAAFPTRAGLFLPRGPRPAPGADSGAWLYHEGKLYPVVRHATGTVAVSPDGCKIALDVRRDPKIVAGAIRIVDLCPG